MSVIPKIKVGMPKRRERLNLSFDCSTTANIGSIQPTMAREMVPNETFKVKVGSMVRLLALNVPTFGRMSLRHYHCYVPYKEIWEPFECMLSGQHYANGSTPFIPTATPYFTMNSILKHVIMNYSIVSAYERFGSDGAIGDPIIFNPLDPNWDDAAVAAQLAKIDAAWQDLRVGTYLFGGQSGAASSFNAIVDADHPSNTGDSTCGYFNLGNYAMFQKYSTQHATFDPEDLANSTIQPTPGGDSVVTPEGADFITGSGNYIFCFKLKPVAKNFRRIMIGLGYQFSPYSASLQFSPLKLIAYYKAWFELFRPIRQMSFQDTNCYKLCHWMRNQNGTNVDAQTLWIDFIKDLCTDCFYYLPMDYFSMATTSPIQPNSDTNLQIRSAAILGSGSDRKDIAAIQGGVNHNVQGYGVGNVGLLEDTTAGGTIAMADNYQVQNPIYMKMAMRLLTFCNKNTVIGRSVRQWLKAHYGVGGDEHSDFNAVYRIGSSRTNVQIGDVMSTAETQDMPLGGFAGKGIGYGDSEKFDFTAKEFGVWLTLTVVVPESGYFQGYMLENRHRTRYQFFMDEFDALGYQVLERGEVIDDYNSDGKNWNPTQGATLQTGQSGFDRSAAFGLVPRYSEYKVGRNIVNGDLSLVGMYNSMAPYTLDRRIPAGALAPADLKVTYHMDGEDKVYDGFDYMKGPVKPGFVPSVVYDNFRRLDLNDHLGQYNRIFTYGRNDIDHFIIHNVFSVDAFAPMKSLTSSFDTVQEGDKVIDVAHS